MKTLTKLAGFLLALALVSAAQATVITYVGRQIDTGTNWRTAAVSKPLDLNGDNILGTDGYQVVNRPAVQPSYMSSMAILAGTSSAPNNASMDDPTNASARFVTGTMLSNVGVVGASANLFRFTLNGNAVGRTIRVGLLMDNLDNSNFNASTFTLVLTNGTGATSPEVTTTLLPFKNRKPDWLFFDITGAANGDSFLIRGKAGNLAYATLGGVAFDSATVAWSFNGPTDPALAALDAAMTNYMAIRTISRGALAVTKDGKLVLHRAYTYAPAGTAPTETTNLFRIASLSKQFTAVGVLQLAQAGKLNLTNTIGKLLNLTNLVDSRFTNVTVQQLLQHTGGWNRDKVGGYDPMFLDTQINAALGRPLPTTPQMIIDYMQRQPLDFDPGTDYHYSNFGYCLLGRIIEAVSGQTYENYIRANVLRPAGIWDMQLGRALLTNALPAEVDYEDPTSAILNSVMGANSPAKVPYPYGGFNLDATDSHGAWVATAADLVRFSSCFDVITNSPLLSSNWIYKMWSAPSFQPNATLYYADGWLVRPQVDGTYIAWHDGSLPGTYAFNFRLPDGICAAMVFNRRYSDVRFIPPSSDEAILDEVYPAIYSVTTWPAVDYFNRVVTTLADSGPGSLREAVSSLAAGSTITFVPGLSGRTITLTSGELLLTENLTIDASSLPAGIRVSGNNSSRVFNVAPGVTASLTGLTIQNGYAPNAANPNNYGGGILNRGALTLTDCTVTACRALQGSKPVGGGIGNFGAGATLTLQNCTISSNQADAYGGGINISSGAAILNQCTFAANFSSNYGGGVSLAAGSLFINQCTVASNSAAASGGIHKETGSLTVSNSIVAGNLPNTSTPYTGGYNLTSGNPSLAPLANYGGPTQTMPPLPGSPAIDAGAATTLATDQRGLPRSAGARVDIGAVELQAPYPVVTSTSDSGPGSLRQLLSQVDVGATLTFAGHLSGQTIALTSGQLLLSNILIIDASALPGGIRISGTRSSRVFEIATNSTVVLDSLTITNGSNTNSVAFGGGMYSSGTLTLNRCTFSGNSAAASGGGSGAGGGLYVRAGVATLNSCTLSGNHAGAGGGAIANPAGVLTLNQCTLAGNSADGSGGAISFGGQGGTVSLNQCTVSQNSAAASAGGISHASSTLAISNSIVAGNAQSSGGDINGAGTFTGVNLTNGTPLLAPLANYGGPTQTMPPLPGSPVVDGCTGGTSFATDQRGKPRIVGAYADIGAVEGVFNPVFPLVNVMKLGSGNVRFRFTNLSGPSYTVLATTNLAAPLNTWSNLGTPTESPAGTFTFTDLQATNNPQRFYHVRGP